MATQTTPGQRRQWVASALEKYEVPLVRFARRLLGDEDAARDVVQHAFLRLCDQSPDDLADRVGPWLFTVCRNRAVDWMRSHRRVAPLEDLAPKGCISREVDPAMAAEQHDLYCRLNQVVAQLPVTQREVIALWTEGCTYREIAEILETSQGNVRVLMHRALKSVRQHPTTRQLLGGLVQPDLPKPGRQPDEVRR
jgi:RNA polymerase sigma-70 factor (ECF subfamily)